MSNGDGDTFKQCKIVILGHTRTGKTALVDRYTKDTFSSDYRATLGADFSVKQIESQDCEIIFQLWDVSGQDVQGVPGQVALSGSCLEIYFRDAALFVVTFDFNDEATFDFAKALIEELKKGKHRNVPIILVGNKSDLEKQVSQKAAAQYAKKQNLLYHETSAKKNTGIDELFGGVLNTVNLQKTYRNEQEETPDLTEWTNALVNECGFIANEQQKDVNTVYKRDTKLDKQNSLKTIFNGKGLSIAARSALFNWIVKDDNKVRLGQVNRHRHDILDAFLFFKRNTASWTRTVGDIREKALNKLKGEVSALNTDDEKLERLKWAEKQSLFKEHRKNHWWQGAFGRTKTVKKIQDMQKTIRLGHELAS